MESVCGIDVSWMSHSTQTEQQPTANNNNIVLTSTANDHTSHNVAATYPNSTAPSGQSSTTCSASESTSSNSAVANPSAPLQEVLEVQEVQEGQDVLDQQPLPQGDRDCPRTSQITSTAPPRPRPNLSGTSSVEKPGQNVAAPNRDRKRDWLSNIISSKLTSGLQQSSHHHHSESVPTKHSSHAPKPNVSRNAVLQPSVKVEGDEPYVPAPPRPGRLRGVFRRLSSNSRDPVLNKAHHGLVDRVVLNVNHHRERCKVKDLNQNVLRRVAFCVDVEIAPLPVYNAQPSGVATVPLHTGPPLHKVSKSFQRKVTEREEGLAFKAHNGAVDRIDDQANVFGTEGVPYSELPPDVGALYGSWPPSGDSSRCVVSTGVDHLSLSPPRAESTEKSTKSEEDRKARREKKRQLAETNGSIPMEIYPDRTELPAISTTVDAKAGVQAHPTTNPVRIYRRCCQLREAPILKKISDQLTAPSNSTEPGVVDKLDITSYLLNHSDLVVLGDYFAIVPVKDVVLDNCGLTDEGVRVVLAGLLATTRPGPSCRRASTKKGTVTQGGFVQRLTLRNNSNIGPVGWSYIVLFINMCRSLKQLDVSGIPFSCRREVALSHITMPDGKGLGQQASMVTADSANSIKPCRMISVTLFSRALSERLAGSQLEMVNLGNTRLKSDQLDQILDAITRCGIRRLGLANNDIDGQGLVHVARYLREGNCEGLDLGGNNLQGDVMVKFCEAIFGDEPDSKKTIPCMDISLANCNVDPSSLSKLLPRLVTNAPKLRYLDLSGNRELFESDPNAIALLRCYLPKLASLRAVILTGVGMTPEQAIQIAEILPEIPLLAHVNILQNPRLTAVAEGDTEESQEEAFALYASYAAAARVSNTMVRVDIDVPRESCSEVVKALGRQIDAYCLRNMEQLPMPGDQMEACPTTGTPRMHDIPPSLANLAGKDGEEMVDVSAVDAPPGLDYVIGGTGVVKALEACLKNRQDETRQLSW